MTPERKWVEGVFPAVTTQGLGSDPPARFVVILPRDLLPPQFPVGLKP